MLTHNLNRKGMSVKRAKRAENKVLRALKAQSYSPTQGRFSLTTSPRTQHRKAR